MEAGEGLFVSAGWLRQQGRKGPGGLPVQRSKSSWPAGSPTILRLPFCLSWPPGRRACAQLDHRTGGLGAQPLLLPQTSPDPIPTAGGVTVLTRGLQLPPATDPPNVAQWGAQRSHLRERAALRHRWGGVPGRKGTSKDS